MYATFDISLRRPEARPLYAAALGGLACAFLIGRMLPVAMDALSTAVAPLCAVSDSAGSALDKGEPLASYSLPNLPGQRRTIVRRFYCPGGFTRAARPAG